MGARLQLQLFLLRLKKVFATMTNVTLYPRDKNIESMSELELDMNDVKAMCLQLTPADCITGPVPHDKGMPGEVWVFHPTYKGIRMYLKLWLTVDNNIDHVTIISCHEEGMV